MKFFTILKNLDNFSKFLLLVIFGIIVYLIYGIFSTKPAKINTSFIEISTSDSLIIEDYFFGQYGKDRLFTDNKLYIKVKNPLNTEELAAYEFRISPVQKIETKLFSENMIEVEFLEASLGDRKENTLLILRDNKQVARINFINISEIDSRAEITPFPNRE